MKIAVAASGGADGTSAAHFAHCSDFVVFEVENGQIKNSEAVKNPYSNGHVPGEIPRFVKSLGASLLITGGIGPSAITFFEELEVDVIYGVNGKAAELVELYLQGKLKPNENSCKH